MPIAPSIAFVDVETTGTSPLGARLTEVAVVRVDRDDGDDGALRVSEWSTLVNPGVPIPPEIRFLTGITDAMVAGAPRFEAIADELESRLRGALFVAHHARFDYGFLKQAFARCGRSFQAPTLCTVRLSRQLYPERSPHTLDALIVRHRLPAPERHRALGDARVLWAFLRHAIDELGPQRVHTAVRRLVPHPNLPAHLPADLLGGIPNAPGIYRFYGLNEHPLYIGKSADLRARVASHFCTDFASERGIRLASETRRVTWEATAGEFGARLREMEAIGREMPAHNRALRRRDAAVVVRIDPDDARARFGALASSPPDALAGAIGPFTSRAAARRALADRARAEGWCLPALGIERAASVADAPCFARQLGRCRGACVGAEPLAALAARVDAAFTADARLPRWPGPPIALVESAVDGERHDWHVVHHWCWIGTAPDRAGAHALAAGAAPRSLRCHLGVLRLLRRVLDDAGEPTPTARKWRLARVELDPGEFAA